MPDGTERPGGQRGIVRSAVLGHGSGGRRQRSVAGGTEPSGVRRCHRRRIAVVRRPMNHADRSVGGSGGSGHGGTAATVYPEATTQKLMAVATVLSSLYPAVAVPRSRCIPPSLYPAVPVILALLDREAVVGRLGGVRVLPLLRRRGHRETRVAGSRIPPLRLLRLRPGGPLASRPSLTPTAVRAGWYGSGRGWRKASAVSVTVSPWPAPWPVRATERTARGRPRGDAGRHSAPRLPAARRVEIRIGALHAAARGLALAGFLRHVPVLVAPLVDMLKDGPTAPVWRPVRTPHRRVGWSQSPAHSSQRSAQSLPRAPPTTSPTTAVLDPDHGLDRSRSERAEPSPLR